MKILENKIALVTGGSRGIGKAISFALAKSGATVVLTYLTNEEQAKAVVANIKDNSSEAESFQMDVRDRKSVKDVFASVTLEFGGIDILVNNAGINNPTDFDQVSDEDWDDILSVNLKGPFICSQEVLSAMRDRGAGSIINVGSVSGQYGGPRTAHYAASKAGLISLGQVVARFGAKDNIRCNTIAAGLIESDMAQAGLQSSVVNKVTENILLQRMGSPSEVAQAVVYLASDASSYITAQTINVNGGLYF